MAELLRLQLQFVKQQLLEHVLALRGNQYLLISLWQWRFSNQILHTKRSETPLSMVFTDPTSVAHPVIRIEEVLCVFMLVPAGTKTLP